jgi:ubiquinone/menaquinone biosynthesis C-methylase UbiE
MNRQNESGKWEDVWGQKNASTMWFEQDVFIQKVFSVFDSISPLRSPILDAGCGRGKFLEYVLRTYGFKGCGADFAYEPIKSCPIPAIVSDACRLGFASQTFYSVISILAIEHISDYKMFFAESYRLLKPGGCLYILCPNFFSLVTPALKLKNILPSKKTNFYFKPLKQKDICNHLEKTGYRILSTSYLSIGSYLHGFERLVGCYLGKLLPEKSGEEIVLVCKKEHT